MLLTGEHDYNKVRRRWTCQNCTRSWVRKPTLPKQRICAGQPAAATAQSGAAEEHIATAALQHADSPACAAPAWAAHAGAAPAGAAPAGAVPAEAVPAGDALAGAATVGSTGSTGAPPAVAGGQAAASARRTAAAARLSAAAATAATQPAAVLKAATAVALPAEAKDNKKSRQQPFCSPRRLDVPGREGIQRGAGVPSRRRGRSAPDAPD